MDIAEMRMLRLMCGKIKMVKLELSTLESI